MAQFASGVCTLSNVVDAIWIQARVEGGMSQSVHCRVIDDLYRSRFGPDHPDWEDVLMHGTKIGAVDSIIASGLICGGISREDNEKRNELYLVMTITGGGTKTAGVKSGSDTIVYLAADEMYADGIKFFISEANKVVYTQGVLDLSG